LIIFGFVKPKIIEVTYDKTNIDKNDLNLLNEIGNELYSCNKIDKALAVALSIIEISNNDIKSHNLAARCYMSKGMVHIMTKHFDKVKELENNIGLSSH
jgi:hypothetical protein